MGTKNANVNLFLRNRKREGDQLTLNRFLAIALSCDFVMSSILALSATHLGWKTQNTEIEHLADYHRGVALKGLHEAIGAFSRDNSEAILAASMLLSWQASEW